MRTYCMQGDARGYDWPPPPRGRDLRAGWEASWHGGRLPPPPQRHLPGRDSQDSPPHMRGPASSIREVSLPGPVPPLSRQEGACWDRSVISQSCMASCVQ